MSSFATDEEKQDRSQRPLTVADDGYATPEASNLDESNKDGSTTSPQPDSGIALDWDGPQDPASPRNWAFKKRVLNTAIPSFMALLVSVFP